MPVSPCIIQMQITHHYRRGKNKIKETIRVFNNRTKYSGYAIH
ncbi:MAG: hypothetical protein PWQ06_2189 [Anaerophaga sp.]|nr:hypothetical protein [Anaerophaga sp.]